MVISTNISLKIKRTFFGDFTKAILILLSFITISDL